MNNKSFGDYQGHKTYVEIVHYLGKCPIVVHDAETAFMAGSWVNLIAKQLFKEQPR